jgi:hypothetical protein
MVIQNKAAFGIFRKQAEIMRARLMLKSAGFSDSSISVQYPLKKGMQDFTQGQESLIKPFAIIGAAVGGVAMVLISILVILNTIPITLLQNIDSNFAHLLLMGGAVVGSMILGAACGALVGIGTPRGASDRYGNYMDVGGILMSVHVDDFEEELAARDVLKSTGAHDISLMHEKQGRKNVKEKIYKNFLITQRQNKLIKG